MGNILSSITFAEVAPSAAKGNPSISVRAGGVLVSNAHAEEIVGANAEGKNIFKVGSDGTGKLYLVPATAEDSNVVKATKNGDKFQFKQVELFKSLGAVEKSKYAVTKEVDGDVTYFVLTPNGKAEPEEKEAGNAEAPATV